MPGFGLPELIFILIILFIPTTAIGIVVWFVVTIIRSKNKAQAKLEPLPNTNASEEIPDWLQQLRDTPSQTVLSSKTERDSKRVLGIAGETLYTWKIVLFSPNLQVFQEEKYDANIIVAIAWMLVAGFVSGLIYGLVNVFFLASFSNSPYNLLGIEKWIINIVIVIFYVIITTLFAPLNLMIISGIVFVIAKLFGGQGDFQKQTYLIATFFAPLSIIFGILGINSGIGIILFFLWTAYQVFLGHYVIQVIHKLDFRKSYLVAFAPVGIMVVLFSVITLVGFIVQNSVSY